MIAKQIVTACLAALLLPLNVAAQHSQVPEKEVAKVRKKIVQKFEASAPVKLELRDGRRIQGSISEIRAEDSVLVDGGRITTLTFAEVKEVKGVGRSWNRRLVVGIAVVGGLIAIALYGASQTR